MPLVEKPEQRTLKADPLEPPDYTEADIQALRALNRGDASGPQQIRAMEYIVNWLCCTYDTAFRPNDRLTNLQLGKTLVGQQLLYMLKYAPTKTSNDEIAARPREER